MKVRRLSAEDPNVLAEVDGELYRFIYRSATRSGRWAGLAEFLQSPTFASLVRDGFVPAHELVQLPQTFDWERPGDRLAVFHVERIEPFSYRRDWTTAQARDVVLAAARLNLSLMRKGSCYLCNECLDWNFTFHHTRPVMVDAGAFSKDVQCIRRIPSVLKVALSRARISLPGFNFNRALSIGYLEEFATALRAAKIIETPTPWDRYGHAVTPTSITDITPTTDEERGMLELERDGSWIDRMRSEAVFVSSVTHHLYSEGFDFSKQAELWGRLAKRWLLVEFIDPGDENIRSMKMGSGYTFDAFMAPLQSSFRMRGSRNFMDRRTWYLFERADT